MQHFEQSVLLFIRPLQKASTNIAYTVCTYKSIDGQHPGAMLLHPQGMLSKEIPLK